GVTRSSAEIRPKQSGPHSLSSGWKPDLRHLLTIRWPRLVGGILERDCGASRTQRYRLPRWRRFFSGRALRQLSAQLIIVGSRSRSSEFSRSRSRRTHPAKSSISIPGPISVSPLTTEVHFQVGKEF